MSREDIKQAIATLLDGMGKEHDNIASDPELAASCPVCKFIIASKNLIEYIENLP